jgi:hypothetical protein
MGAYAFIKDEVPMHNAIPQHNGAISEALYRHFPGESDCDRLKRLVKTVSLRAASDTKGFLKNELTRLEAELERVSSSARIQIVR